MRYKVILKDKKEFELSETQKIKIEDAYELWINERKDTLIKLNGTSFSASNIDKVLRLSDPKIQSAQMIQKINNDYLAERKRFVKLPIDQKVTQKRAFIDFMFLSLTGNRIPEENIQEIKTITLNFFKENPNRLYPDITLYKHLMEQKGTNIKLGVTILMNIISEDMRQAKFSPLGS